MSRAEAAIVARIRVALRKRFGIDWYSFKVHGDEYTVNQPDIVGCLSGRCVVIECKVPGEHARPGQLAILRKWERAGAIVIVDASSVAMVMAGILGGTPDDWRNLD